MTRTLSISDTGLRLIKAFEGFRPVDRELVTGARVVGYGHRLDSDDPVRMSRSEAEEQLLDDLEFIEEMVNDEVHAPLSQGQYDALCSLAFNIGPETFRTSDIVRAMNNGRVLHAANGFDVWRKATINGKTYVVDALMRRRTAEKSLFLRNEPAVPAPSAMLVPKPDHFAPLGPTDDGLPEFTDTDTIGIVPNVVSDTDEGLPETNVLPLSNANITTISDDKFDLDEIDGNDLDDDGDDDAYDEGIEDYGADDLYEDDLDDSDHDLVDDETELEGFQGAGPKPELDEDLGLNLEVEDNLAVLGQALDGESQNEKTPDNNTGDSIGDEDDDIYQLRVDDAIEIGNIEDALDSPIAAAADSLGDRLSALLDSDENAERNPALGLPESLLQAVETEVANPVLVTDADDSPDSIETETAPRSNLVSFPKQEIVLENPVVEDAIETVEIPSDVVSVENDREILVIDNLAADDVMCSSRDTENPVFDPDGDPVENAMRYLERQANARDEQKTGGGLWVPLTLGGLLVGASAVMIGRGATQALGAWGPTAATASAITGGLLVLFTIYAAARGRFD